MGKNEDAWDILFAERDILNAIKNSGRFEIAASEINAFRQSRLMTKFDHRANLPGIFRENHLAILPVTRGSYVIGDFQAYVDQTYDHRSRPEEFLFPEKIESLDPADLFSEAAAINAAYVSGMIDAVVGQKTRPTVSGRMGTSKFDFTIDRPGGDSRHRISVDNCQCEIDGGFEGDGVLALIEAKNAISENFIIRQLYYPYRLWSEKVRKRVVPIFLSFSNDVFNFFVYEFPDPGDYNSLRLVARRKFMFAPERIGREDIRRLLDRVAVVDEPAESFPQADRFERVVDLLGLVARGETEAADITRNYDFDPRQTRYYTGAARYLGLIESGSGLHKPTAAGARIMRLGYKPKYLALAERILAHQAFHKVCRLHLERGEKPSRDQVVEIMKACKLRDIDSEATYGRRAQTVLAWTAWILDLCREGIGVQTEML